MLKKSLIFVGLVLLMGALIVTGCSNPNSSDSTDTEQSGEGSKGGTGGYSPNTDSGGGPTYLNGELETVVINDGLASSSVKIGTVTQSDPGIIIIPAGKNVDLVGTFKLDAGGILIVTDGTSIKSGSTGKIDITSNTGAVAIVPNELKSYVTGTPVILQTPETFTFSGTSAALKGDVTIDDGTDGIDATDIVTNTLYVVGNLTVSADLSGAAKITVTEDVTVDTAATGAVVWNIQGNLKANKTPTASGDLTVKGTATFTEAAVLGAVDIGGDAEFKSTASVGGGSDTVSFGGDVTLTGTNALTLNTTDAVTLAKGKSIKIGTVAILKAGAAADLVLTPGTAGTLLKPDTNKISTSTQDITITSGELIVAGGKTLELGAVTHTVNGTLTLENGAKLGTVSTGTNAKLVFGDTSIAGGANAATITASDGTVSFTEDNITGKGSAPKLAVTGEDVSILVDTDGELVLTAVNLDLTAKGKITLTKGSSGAVASAITLKGGNVPGKITFDNTKETVPVTIASHGNIAGTDGKTSPITGTGIVAKAATDGDGALYGSIAGGAAGNDAKLGAQASTGANAVLSVGAKVEDTAA
jgi:hypothetical protein